MEELKSDVYCFQTDSKSVREVYRTRDNFLVEHSSEGDKEWCAVYFSSNDIYYPNTEEIFKKRIVEKDFYEWYRLRISKACKHIFVRDIFKQWYLKGVNSRIDNPEKFATFLRKETCGFRTIMVGSSAGGYAAILYGSMLGAEKVLAFNSQFELASLLSRSDENTNPLLFRLKENNSSRKYFDITPIINPKTKIYYFYSKGSEWDSQQNGYLERQGIKSLYKIPFSSKHHGIPFLKVALPVVLNMEDDELAKFIDSVQNPILFTIKMVGIKKTVSGFVKQAYLAYKKRR